MVTFVAVALVSSEFIGTGGELVAHVSSQLALIIVVAHETVSMETSNTGALVTSLGVLAVGVDVAVVFRHFALVLIDADHLSLWYTVSWVAVASV